MVRKKKLLKIGTGGQEKMERTLKDVALELLALYQNSETSVIYEYSGSIEEDIHELDKECDAYREEIERLSKDAIH